MKKTWLGVPLSLYFLALITIIIAYSVPLMVKRQGGHWDSVWAQPEVSISERYLQFNSDQMRFLPMVSNFPGHFYESAYQIARPVYPGVCSVFCRVFHFFTSVGTEGPEAFINPCPNEARAAAMVVNLIIFIGTIIFFYKLLQKLGFSANVTYMSTAFFTLWGHMTYNIINVATDLPGIVMSVFVLGIAYSAGKDASLKKLICLGLLLGIIMLTKPQYDVFGLAILILLFLQKWKAAGILVATHFIPLLVFSKIILPAAGLTYYNHEVEKYGQGTFIYKEFIYMPFSEQTALIWDFLKGYFNSFVTTAFGPIITALLIAGTLCAIIQKRPRNLYLALLLITAICVNFAFTFSIRMHYPHLLAVNYCIVFVMAAVGYEWLTKNMPKKLELALRTVCFAAFSYLSYSSLLSFVRIYFIG